MPWKECHVEDERLRFVARRLDGESMTALCAEFGGSGSASAWNASSPAIPSRTVDTSGCI